MEGKGRDINDQTSKISDKFTDLKRGKTDHEKEETLENKKKKNCRNRWRERDLRHQ